MPKKIAEDWLMPPPARDIKPLRVATGVDKKGNWIWKEVKQKPQDKKLRKEWNARMKKADKKRKDRFKWPPKD